MSAWVGVPRSLSVVFQWLKTDFKHQSWSGCWSGSIGLYIEISFVSKECVSSRSLGVGRNVNSNTDLKTQYYLIAFVPKKDKSNEKDGHQLAARRHATHSSRVRHTIFPTACLLFFFAVISLNLTTCIYSIAYKHTLSVNPQLHTVIIIIIINKRSGNMFPWKNRYLFLAG